MGDMNLRRRNNLIMLLTAMLIFSLLILSRVDRERRRATETPVDPPTGEVSLLALAIESMLSDEEMVDSLAIRPQEGNPHALSPAESLFVHRLAKTHSLPAESVRSQYLRIRARVFGEGSF